MEAATVERLTPGTRVLVIQQIPRQRGTITQEVRGTIVALAQRPTGSWYAHSRGDRLWLDRLVLQREDGEILTLSLDDHTRIEVLDAPAVTV
jgi:hypothetical protein